jgi:hypothetical protein
VTCGLLKRVDVDGRCMTVQQPCPAFQGQIPDLVGLIATNARLRFSPVFLPQADLLSRLSYVQPPPSASIRTGPPHTPPLGLFSVQRIGPRPEQQAQRFSTRQIPRRIHSGGFRLVNTHARRVKSRGPSPSVELWCWYREWIDGGEDGAPVLELQVFEEVLPLGDLVRESSDTSVRLC